MFSWRSWVTIRKLRRTRKSVTKILENAADVLREISEPGGFQKLLLGFWGLWGKFYAKKTFHHESSISWLSTLRLLTLTIAIWHILENDYRNQAHEKNNKFQVTKVFFCVQVKQLSIRFERFPSTRSHLRYLMHSLSSMELMKLQWEHLCVHCQESWNRYKTHFEHVAGLPGPCVLVYRPQKPNTLRPAQLPHNPKL